MSGAFERAMGVLEGAESTVVASEATGKPRVTRCWRCQKNPGRVPGEDVTCEACFAWMTGESDEDPSGSVTPETPRTTPQPHYFPWWWPSRERNQ